MFLEAILEVGPVFLSQILADTYENRQNKVAVNVGIVSNTLWSIEQGFNYWTEMYPLLYPASEYHVVDLEETLPFLPVLERPTLGWVKLCLHHNPIHESAEPTDLWHLHQIEWDWAFAIWDSERLLRWKAPILGGNDEDT